MRSRRRLNVSVAAALVALVLVCGYSLLNIMELVRTNRLIAHTQEVRSEIGATFASARDAVASERGYLLTGNRRELAPFDNAITSIESHLTRLRLLAVDNPRQRANLRQVEPLMARRIQLLRDAIRHPHGPTDRAALVERDRGVGDSLRAALGSMEQDEHALLGPRQAHADAQARRTMTGVIAGALVAAFIALLLAFLLRRDFVRRQQSETMYRSVIDVLAEGVFVRDQNGIIIECNPSAERILGLSREELLGTGQGDIECFNEDGTPKPVNERPGVTARRGGAAARSEILGIRRPDGEMRWLLVNAAPMHVAGTGKLAGITTSFADITRRKEAEAAVRENREQLQDFLDHADELILIANAGGSVLYANRAWRDTMGYREDHDVIGKLVTDFLDPSCRERYHDDLRRLVSGEVLHGVETTFVARDGHKVAVSGNSNCRFEHGIPVATRSIMRDMTEINVAQEQLILAIEQASAASRAKSEFLANMSHELRTPLNSVIGFSNVLLRNKGNHLDVQDVLYINRIHDNGRHLLSLINSVLDLSKVEAGRMELELNAVDLGVLVRETLAQLESQVHGRPVTLCAVVPAFLGALTTDAGKLKQVLINLVANALKFTEQGTVTVRVVAGPGRRPIAIEVVDTGIGIPLDRQGAVFEAFRQADNSTARRFGGSGLGLTITRSLCQLMGYEVSLSSEPGVGTTFTVTLAAQEAANATPAMADGTPHVLIIDDDPDARLLLTQYVRDAGFEAVAIGTGQQGLRLAGETQPSLILLDIMMPQMNGLEVLEKLRADPKLMGIPVVIVSIVATEQRSRAIGAAALIDKPVQREEIEAVLRNYIAQLPLDKHGQLGELIRASMAVPA